MYSEEKREVRTGWVSIECFRRAVRPERVIRAWCVVENNSAVQLLAVERMAWKR